MENVKEPQRVASLSEREQDGGTFQGVAEGAKTEEPGSLNHGCTWLRLIMEYFVASECFTVIPVVGCLGVEGEPPKQKAPAKMYQTRLIHVQKLSSLHFN